MRDIGFTLHKANTESSRTWNVHDIHVHIKIYTRYVVKVDVEWPLPECNLNLSKNITKKYIFILNRVVLKPIVPRSICERLIFPFFYMKKKDKSSKVQIRSVFKISKKIKSKYRSENSIYRIFNSFVRTSKNRPQRHFQTKYTLTYNQCQRRKYVNIGVWTDI